MSKSKLKNKTIQNVNGWLFALPAMLGFLIFNLVPMFMSGYYSLCNYSILKAPEFIGFENYVNLFSGATGNFWVAAKATLLYTIMAVPANLIFALFIAVLLNRKMVGRTFFRSVFYLPCILPAVATSFVWILLANPDFGLFNTVLEWLHLPSSMFFWGKDSVLQTIVFMGIWSTGSTQVIFLAGLQDIPQVYYEAIEIDGGNAWQKFLYITLPMLSPTLFFNLVMGIIGALQVFGQAYIITEGGPNNASLFYVYELWRQAFKYMDMGVASAMAWILFIVVLILTAVVFKTSRTWVYYAGGEEE
ncbi:MAG: sugar ABC transporter permease [Blautia sp.]|nr:sugar ABC transporter permease [Blautia sp.]MDY3999196.1 sugar ABC transporter permease [Blautia sp.]